MLFEGVRRLSTAAASRRAVALAAGGAAAFASSSLQPLPAASASSWLGGDKYHLRYFNARGAVETSRMLLVLAGKEFTDDRWPLDFSKPRSEMSPAMTDANSKGLLVANLDRAPVLVVNGKHEIGQSKTIERYLAKKLGLLGSSDIEAAHIDAFTEHLRDLKELYNKAKATADVEERKTALSKFFAMALPKFLLQMEAAVTHAGGGAAANGALIGKSLSLADISLFIVATEYFENKAGVKQAMKECPRLVASTTAVGAHPAIAKYLAARPVTAV